MSKPEETVEENGGEVVNEFPTEAVVTTEEHNKTAQEIEEPNENEGEAEEKEMSDKVTLIQTTVPEEEPIKMDVSPAEETHELVQPPPSGPPVTSAPPKNEQTEEDTDDESQFNSNPQVNIEDMKAAQDELNELDVLVCGSCHNVFHFVEGFNRHKLQCKRKSNFHGNIAETKPQVWAFLLWKNAQTKVTRRGIPVEESSWKLYQKWCKMPERIRNAWVAAGETVMNFTTFGYPKPSDKFGKKVEKGEYVENACEEEKPVIMRKFVQRDHMGEIKEIRSSGIIKKRLKEDIENIRNQLEDGDSSQDKEPEEENEIEPRLGCTKIRRVKTQDGSEMMLQEEEFVVEKIVSRRFNPRKKQYEYLIKWEGYPSEQNTWEPAENMEACQHLLKAFEENLAKQSLAKQSVQNRGAASRKTENNQAGPSGLNSYGRPVRHSKQKALNQVKAWCGSIKPDDVELDNLVKRKFGSTDSDDEDPNSKRIKLELESDSEDSMMGGGHVLYTKGGSGGIVKRGRGRVAQSKQQHPVSNGTGTGTNDNLAAALGLESSGDEGDPNKTKSTLALLNQKTMVKKVSSLSPANQQVLVANAKGVVKIDPSQVPNLTSGVYIMSNKSGIIKLDSVSPSKALSLKQGSVKQTSTSPKGGVIMLKNQGPGTQKSGIVRKNPGILRGGGVTPRGPGRPPNPRPSGMIRVENPNARVLQSGIVARSQINIATNNRPKLPLLKNNNTSTNAQRKAVEIEKRILGPKNNRGGIGRGGIFRGRGGISKGTASSVSDDMESVSSKGKDGKLLDSDSVVMDFPQDSDTSESEPGLPDDFPIGDLPPLEPESPPRPLTLCPLTGKVLAKAEGEKTPEPTPPPSPKPATPPPSEKDKVEPNDEKQKGDVEADKAKTEDSNPSDSPTSAYLNKLNNKDAILKKTFKPGSIGSVTVSPKKILETVDTKVDESDVVTITGEDGLIYKVSNAELGNTLLVSGEDGQQCVYVTTGEDADDNTAVLTLDPSYADAIAHMSQSNILGGEGEGETQFYVKEGEDGEIVSLQVQSEGAEDPQSQVVAQLVEAGEPAPGGGPRRVVLLLPDGNLMVTEVDEEQYAALELDKFQTAGGEIE